MKGLITGVKRHPWQTAGFALAAIGILWTIIDLVTYCFPNIDMKGCGTFITVLIVSVVSAGIKIRQPTRVEIPIKHTTTTIEIKFGDLFAEEGYRAIAVTEFFDSELGVPVSERSLHGAFLKKCFGGHQQAFDAIVSRELKSIQTQSVDKKQGKNTKYPIGTTALVPVNEDNYFCFALCKADIETCKASADVPTLWTALNGLWNKARICLGGNTLVVPLVGSGLSGVGLPARDLLDLLILSAITETKQKQITNRVCIVLTPNMFDSIDLSEIKRHWS